MQAYGPAQASAAEGMLSQALGGLRVVAEQYPELRATENFQQLSRNLSELEDEIQASRRIYNSNVQAYNTKIQVFPNSVVASSGGFTAREFFEIEDPGDREVPTSRSTAAPLRRPPRHRPPRARPRRLPRRHRPPPRAVRRLRRHPRPRPSRAIAKGMVIGDSEALGGAFDVAVAAHRGQQPPRRQPVPRAPADGSASCSPRAARARRRWRRRSCTTRSRTRSSPSARWSSASGSRSASWSRR